MRVQLASYEMVGYKCEAKYLARLFDGVNLTSSEQHMCLFEFSSSQGLLLKLKFQKPELI